jgi:beta-lactamase regulating signal transducer with metallopeptidase domain
MMWPHLQMAAQMVIGSTLNSLPEGLLIALFAWMMLRFLPRQNSGTRFAVWFVALLAVAGLSLIGAGRGGHSLLSSRVARPLITVPGFWASLLFLAWVLAACVAVLRLATGLWRLRGLRRSCITIDAEELDRAVGKTIADFSSSRSVFPRSATLATSERVSVPAAIGFFKPMIVIPSWALRELRPEELNVILLHEFAHLRRWDDWTNLLQKIVRAVFLFHPAVWWIESQLALEREMACDDLVLAETANPHGYAKCLVALLEKSFARRGWAMAQAIVHRAREASLRLAQILDVRRPDTSHVWKPALSLVGAFSLVCLMAVPRAPQFVAFEWNPRAIHTGVVQTAALSQSQFLPAAVIPAAMRTRQSSSREKMPRQPATQAVERHSTGGRVVVARWSAERERSPIDMVTAGVKQTVLPARETILVIRTTQSVGPNSWVWSVCVWRVTLVNPAQNGAASAPVAHRT